jgi:PQQ-like domain
VPGEPVVIDLGELGPAGSRPEALWPGWDRVRRPLRNLGMRALVLIVAAVTVATATAAAPTPRALVPVLAVGLGEAGASLATEDALYVLDSRTSPAELTSYGLPDGAVRWRTTVESVVADGGGPGLELYGGVLVSTAWRGLVADVPPVVSTAYEPSTGAVLWRLEGAIVGRLSGGRLLVSRETPTTNDGSTWIHEYFAVEPGSFAAAWSIRLPADAASYVSYDWYGLSGDQARMVAVSDTGRLRSYDLATGAMLAERRMPGWAGETQVMVVGDVVVVSTPDGFLADVRAYGTDDLAFRWETRALRDQAGFGCGQWICLSVADGLRAVDPATGARAWERRELSSAFPPPGPEWPTGTLLGLRADGTDAELLDATTGRGITNLGVWQPMGGGEKPPFLIRSPHLTPGTPGFWLGRFRPESGAVEIVSGLPNVTYCTVTGRYLACRSLQDVTVWRIRT